jgi:hypothetical protein
MDAKVTEFVVISITQYEKFVRLQERFEMAKGAMGSSPYPDRNRWELLRMILQAEEEAE